MMPTTLTLAAMASLLLPVQAVKQPPTAPPHKFKTARRVAAFQGATLDRGI